MNQKQFKIVSLLIVMAVGVAAATFVSAGKPILAVTAVLAGMAIMYVMKSRTEEVVEDERVLYVGEKASRLTFQVAALVSAFGGAALIALRDIYPAYTDLGFFLAYASCGILLLYSLFYTYYKREYGG